MMCDAVGTACVAALVFAGGSCIEAHATVKLFGDVPATVCATTVQAAMFGTVFGLGASSVSGRARVDAIQGSTNIDGRSATASCGAPLLAWRGCGNVAGLTVSGTYCAKGSANIRALNSGSLVTAYAYKETNCKDTVGYYLGLVMGALRFDSPAFFEKAESAEGREMDMTELHPDDQAALAAALHATLRAELERETQAWPDELRVAAEDYLAESFQNVQGTVIVYQGA